MIPREIPLALRSLAIIPAEAAEHEAAWTPRDALAVLEVLEYSRVAVTSAQAYKLLGQAIIPIEGAWDFPPTTGETESSRARKSRAGAAVFVRKLDSQGVDYVSLEFSYQDEAA